MSDAPRSRLHFLGMRAPAQRLDGGELHQLADLRRQRTEAVDHLGREGLDLRIALERRQPSIEVQAHLQVGNIILGDRHRRAGGDRRRPGFLDGLLETRLEGGHRLFEHLLIEFVTDFLDMAGLLVAQQVAGAADVEVVAGELEPGAERVERLQHFETFFRLRGERPVGGHGIHARYADDAMSNTIEYVYMS